MRAEPTSDEYVDQSEWLPYGTPIITKERRAKGDLYLEDVNQEPPKELKHVYYAQAQVCNILNYLAELGQLDDQHLHDGRTYEIWREVFSANFGSKRSPIYGAMKGELNSQGLNEYGFVLLIQRLSVLHQKAIELSIYTFASSHARYMARQNARAYRTAFDRLIAIIPDIRDELSRIEPNRIPTEEEWQFVRKRLREAY